jgi:hypothetical protein
MGDFQELIQKIIPPADYQHRNGFCNKSIIDSLDFGQKSKVEEHLLNELHPECDSLVSETLVYLKSERALAFFKNQLEETNDYYSDIHLAKYIGEISGFTDELRDKAYSAFLKIEDKNRLIFLFHDLVKFNDTRIDERIKSYQNDKDILISHNAKTSLNGITEEEEKHFPHFLWIIPLTFILIRLFIGTYAHDEFNETHIFIKHQPTWKWHFYSPRGMSDMKLEDMAPKSREEQLLFDEYIWDQGHSR